MSIKLKEVLNDEKYSRFNIYVYVKNNIEDDLNFMKELSDIKYVDFEGISLDFFKKSKLTLKEFNRNILFKFIKDISLNNEKILIIDKLEIIQNILHENNEFDFFLRDLLLQKFNKKVIFIFSNIKIMKIQSIINNNIPENNIIMEDLSEN